MENGYKLKFLLKEDEICNDMEIDRIFFKMIEFMKGAKCINVTYELTSLEKFLSDDVYFVAQKITLKKGKVRIFNGAYAIATKMNLLVFLKDAIKNNDLRQLVISPVFSDEPQYVVYVHDDVMFFLYTNDAS